MLGPAGLAAAAGIAAVVEKLRRAAKRRVIGPRRLNKAKQAARTGPKNCKSWTSTAKATRPVLSRPWRGALQSLGMIDWHGGQDNFAKGKNNAGTKANEMAILGIDDPKKGGPSNCACCWAAT